VVSLDNWSFIFAFASTLAGQSTSVTASINTKGGIDFLEKGVREGMALWFLAGGNVSVNALDFSDTNIGTWVNAFTSAFWFMIVIMFSVTSASSIRTASAVAMVFSTMV